jgi:CRP-like cAMP-binding protein
LNTRTPDLSANKLLAALPHAVSQSLNPLFSIVPMRQGTLLFETDVEVDHIFFPLSGMISLLVVLKNGDAIETGTVGREGVVGAMEAMGVSKSRVRAVVQLAATVARVPAGQFRKLIAANPALSTVCTGYNEVLLAQARVTAACNISHEVEARFCRWLLQCRDRVENDTVPLTQEFLSEMLGVRRTSVTLVAVKMQEAGAISYSRGIIKIVDLEKLKALSCECYETLRNEAPS